MPETIKISQEERKRLTSGREVDRPKYTFFALNNAVEYSGANRKEVLGDVKEIYENYERRNPDCSFEEWKEYYLRECDGEEKIQTATDEAYDQLITIREAIKQINRSDVEQFIRGFTLYGTYENKNAKEAVKNKLLTERSDVKNTTSDEVDSWGVDLSYGDYYIKLADAAENVNIESDRIILIEFEEQSDGDIDVYLSNLNKSLDDF